LFDLIETVERKITFIDDKLLPLDVLTKAEGLTADVDCDDMPFIAVAEFLHANLWTGDKKLINGLAAKNYANFKTTKEMSELLDAYEVEKI
jgi:predicted nucleic acid-binding protein